MRVAVVALLLLVVPASQAITAGPDGSTGAPATAPGPFPAGAGDVLADVGPGQDGLVAAWIWSGPSAGLTALVADLESRSLSWHLLPELGMATFLAPASLAAQLQQRHGGRIDANEAMDLHLDRSVAYIEGDRVRQTVGNARAHPDSPTVLVVDTGVDSAHPDFEDVLVANVIPRVQGGLVVGSLDQVPVVDAAGHGTHVASIVAGSGKGLGEGPTGKYQGLYSRGRLASYQVTLGETSDEPQVDTLAALEAFEWALSHRTEYKIRVVTNSWGASGDFEAQHAVNRATLQLYEAGMVVTFSAGNEGRDGPDTLNKYCQAPWVLCVAAGDLNGARASFSSYGVEDASRPYSHPDLTAPGFQITAAAPIGATRASVLSRLSQEALYTDRSGTSMAAPHVAGTAALLMAANPSLSPDQVMDILVAETDTMADDPIKVGSGYLNARKAFNLAVDTPGQLSRFLDGHVKYAGKASGDPSHANDALSLGYDYERKGAAAPLAAPEEPLWVLGSPVAWALVGAAAVSMVIGTRWGRAKQPVTQRPGPVRQASPQRAVHRATLPSRTVAGRAAPSTRPRP